MNYHFKDYGFDFEETGIGDAMKVKAKNGKEITIDLDPDLSILGVSLIGRGKKKTKESEKLRQFLRDNREESEFLTNTERGYKLNEQKFRNEQDIKLRTSLFNEESNAFKDEVQSFVKDRNDFERKRQQMLTWTQSEINANREEWDLYQEESKAIENRRLKLVQQEKNFRERGGELDKLVGEWTEMEAQKGSWLGGLYNAFLDGSARISANTMNIMADIGIAIGGGEDVSDEMISLALRDGKITQEQLNEIYANNPEEKFKPKYDENGKMIRDDGRSYLIGEATERETMLYGQNQLDAKRTEKINKEIRDLLTNDDYNTYSSKLRDLQKKSLKYDNVERIPVLDSDGKPMKVKYPDGERTMYVSQVKDERNPFSLAVTAQNQDMSMGMVDATRKGLRWAVGDSETTGEWTDLTKEGFWGGALLGLMESVPAMLGGTNAAGWAQRTAQMYSQVSDHVMEEMQDDPDFANISENEKYAVTVPLGIVVGGLEAIGLRNVMKQSGLVNKIVLRVMNKSPKGATPKTFQELVTKEIDSMVARGVITVGAAGMAEFETGFLQEGADIAIKEIYNSVKEKDMFDTPETFGEVVGQMLYAGGQEMVGGLILGVPGGIGNALNTYDFSKLDESQWKIFEEINKSEKSHSDYFTFFVQDIKQKILKGELTKKEGDKILNDFNKVSGVYSQLPQDVTSEQKKQLLGLLLRKQDLQEQIANKDKTLVKKELAEIESINGRMENILQTDTTTETKTDTAPTEQQVDTTLDPATQQETQTETETQQEPLTQEQKDVDAFFGEEVSDNQVNVNEKIVINQGAPVEGSPQSTDLNTFKQTLNNVQKSVVNLAEKGLSAISTIAPNIKMVVHTTQDAYGQNVSDAMSRGEYNPETGVIHINLSKANLTTVPHEIFHAVVVAKTQTDAEASALTKAMMNAVRKTITTGQKSLLDKIEAHASKYDSDLVNEEQLAELMGILASEFKTLSKPQKSAVMSWIKNLGQKLGFKMDFINQLTKDEEAVIDLLNTMAKKISSGEVISDADVEGLGGGRVRKTEDKKTKEKRQPKQQKAPKDLTFEEYIKRNTRQQKEEVAAEKFNLDELEVISKGGTGRIVYQHPTDKNKVIKVATSPRGLEQNASVGFGDFNMLDGRITELFEKGLDYIVVEKVSRNDKVVNKYLKGLKSAYRENGVDRFGNVAPIVQEIMQDKGLIDFLNYNILWGDFLATRNWGVRKDGEVVLVDEGALNDKVFYGSKIEEWAQKEWQQVKDRKRKTRQQQLNLFDQQNEQTPDAEFTPSNFYEQKIKEYKGDKYRAALATQAEVDRREQGRKKVEQPRRPKQKTIQEVLTYFNMSPSGFINKQNTVEYVQRFLPEGYKAVRSKTTYDGYGGGIFVVNRNGRRVKPTQRKTRYQKDMVVPNSGGKTILDYFVEGLENNFSRSAIVDYLTRRKGVLMRDIKNVLKISKSDTKLLESIKLLPKSFGDVKGGLKSGIALFNRVMAYRQRLIDRNKDGRVKRKLSETEINEKTMEFLESQPEYKGESATYKKGKDTKTRKGLSKLQMLMQVELQKNFGKRTTREVGNKMRRLKMMLDGMRRGRSDLNKIKREVRNFMRIALPPGMYTKPEVLKLVRKLELANANNIDNIIKEINEIAIKKNVDMLSKEVTDLLNGKYEQTIGGRKRGYKVDTRAKEILKKIKKAFQGTAKSTAVEIAADNAALQTRYDELSQKQSLTEQEIDEMASLQIMIELNNSRLMLDNNVHKLTSLGSVVEQLADVIVGGKQRLNESIKAQHKEYRSQFAEAFYDITGVKLPIEQLELAEVQYENNPTEENQTKLQEAQDIYDETINKNKREISQKNDAKKVAARVKKLMGSILNGIGNIFHSHEALDGLMDKISMLPGKMFEGKMQTLVTERVDAASREFKGRKLEIEKLLQDKMKEVFGKRWKKIMAENRQEKQTGIYLDPEVVNQAQVKYDNDPTKENLKNLNKVKAEQELILSQEQMYYYYNQYKDPANEGTFEVMYGKDYKRVMEEMTNKLTPETKAFADFQVDVLFPALYEHYNKTYQKIYRTNMPYNEFYAGKMYRDVEMKPLDLLGGDISGTSVGAASTLARVQNTNPIQKMNGTDVLLTYINDMEYFSAYAVPVRDINKLFSNTTISNSIKDIHGKTTNTLIQDAIKKIANKGVRTDMTNFAISHMNDVFILSRLGINPVVMLKQLTSFITYANDIGFINYAKYGMKNITQVKQTWKEIRDNSVYMQDRRNNGIMKAIESYSEKSMQEFVPTWFMSESLGAQKEWLTNFLMFTTKFGDRTAIMVGGMPNYLYYKAEFKKKNPQATEQQAIDYAIVKFEKDTKRTQQSGDLQDKDIMQTGNPVVRALNMFMTTPKQYLRKEIQGFRNLGRKIAAMDTKAGKGTVWENLRTVGMYHVVMPVFFQWVALGMPGLLRGVEDEDKEDLLRAGIIGNLNALFILGEAVNMAGDFFTGKPYAGESAKSVGILNIASRLTKMAKRAQAAKSEEKKKELWMNFYLELSTLSGMPVPQVKKLWTNYSKLYGESMPPGEAIMRLFNYSEWQIQGGQLKSAEKEGGIKLRKKEMEEFAPDLYELKYDNKPEAIIELEEMQKEFEAEEDIRRREILEQMFE